MKILVTGSIAFDRIAVFPGKFADHILPDKVHRLNVSFPVRDMKVFHGGTGGNIAYSLALLGEKPLLLCPAGNDAKEYLSELSALGVDTRYVRVSADKLSAHATIMTDMDDNQITSFYTGAMEEAADLSLSVVSEKITFAILGPDLPKAMIRYAEECREKNIPFIADPGQAIPAFSSGDLIDYITEARVLIANDYEWEMIREKTGLDEKTVFDYADHLIVTYGPKGATIMNRDGTKVAVPAVKVEKAVDPTGCGDAFRAGILYGLNKGKTLEEAAKNGALLASKVVQVKGTQEHAISSEELKWIAFN